MRRVALIVCTLAVLVGGALWWLSDTPDEPQAAAPVRAWQAPASAAAPPSHAAVSLHVAGPLGPASGVGVVVRELPELSVLEVCGRECRCADEAEEALQAIAVAAPGRVLLEARTDASGDVTLPPVDRPAVIIAGAPPLEGRVPWLPAAPAPRSLRLREPVTLAGVVVLGGAPLGNAEVFVGSPGASQAQSQRTDERGAFSLEVQPGEAWLAVAVPGHAPVVRWLEVVEGTELTVELVAGGAVAGTVLDDSGGVAGAVVRLSGEGCGLREVKADRAGRFRFEGLGAGSYQAAAEHEGRVAAASARVGPGAFLPEELELRLGAPPRVEGHVTDALTAKPLGSARVAVCDAGVETSVDFEGHFALVVAPGQRCLRYSALGYARATLDVVAMTEEIVEAPIALRPLIQVHGEVVDEAGAVQGATVSASPWASNAPEDEATALTGPDGRFTLELAAREWELRARTGDGRHGEAKAVDGGARIELEREVRLRGLVVDDEGRPAPGAGLFWTAGSTTRGAEADAEGRFGVLVDAPSAGELSASWTDRRPRSRASLTGTLAIPAERFSAPAVVRLQRGTGTIEGVVRLGAQPVSDAFVGADLAGDPVLDPLPAAARGSSRPSAAGPIDTSTAFMARSGPDGRFRLEGLPPGEYVVVADRPGLAPAGGRVLARAGARDVVVRLEAPGARRLRGRVTTGGGLVPSFLLNGSPVTQGPNGFDVERPADEVLMFEAAGSAPARREPGEGKGDLGEIRLDAARVVQGTVVDWRTGAPILRASVSIDTDLTTWGAGYEATTDWRGRFRLQLAGEVTRVWASAPDYLLGAVDAPAAGGEVTIRLARGGVIAGVVRGPRDARWSRVSANPGNLEAGVRADGTFRFQGLGPGHYRLGVWSQDYTLSGSAEVDVELEREATVTIEAQPSDQYFEE